MKEKFYLFDFYDRNPYEMKCGISFKDALWEMAKYTGDSSELLLKALKGFDSNDIEGIVDLYHMFSSRHIRKVYIVEKEIYSSLGENKNGNT